MPTQPKRHRPVGWRPPEERRQEWDRTRPTAHQRGYDAEWQRESKAYLEEHPLCVMCEAQGRLRMATLVDHKIPHRGNMKLFWDKTNWQGLCTTHHNREKQRQEAADRARSGRDASPNAKRGR